MISTAQAIVYALVVLVGFGFDQLIVRDLAADKSKTSSYIRNVALLRLLLSLVFSFMLYLVVQIFDYSNELSVIIYLYAINAVLTAFSDIGLSVFQAFERMEFNLYARVFRDVINVALSLLAIYLGYSLIVIVGISVFASSLQLLLVIILLRGRFVFPRIDLDLNLSKRLLKASLPFALLAVYPLARAQLNTFILSLTSGMEQVGWFAAANSLVAMLLIIPTIVMQATFPVFSRFSDQSSASLRMAYQKSFEYLFIIGLAISIGTFLAAEEIISLLLGDGYEMAVPALRVLAWLPLVGFVGFCNGGLLLAMRKEKPFMLTEGTFAVAYGILSITLVLKFGYIGACFAIVTPTIIGFGFYSVWCHRLLSLPLPWRTIVLAVIAAVIMGVFVHYSLESGVSFLAVAIIIGPIAYGVALYSFRVFSADDVVLLKQVFRKS